MRTIVFAAAVSAVLGLLLLIVTSLSPQLGLRVFYAAGAARLTGTFDYPNIAAMAYEASAMLGLGLIALDWRRRQRLVWLEIAFVALIAIAMMLTLSRGAAVGAAVGLLTVAVLAFFAQRRRLAGALATSAVFVVVATLLVQIAVAPIQRLLTDAEQGLYGATYEAPAAATTVNGTVSIKVRVTDTGSLSWNVPGGARFELGYHLLEPGTTSILVDGTAEFPLGILAPGQTATTNGTITTPDPSRTYDIAWDVVRNGYSWFSDRGVAAATTRVGAQVAAAPPPTGTAGLVQLDTSEIGPTRSELWTAAAKMILDRPVLGVGPGTYRLRYAGYIGLGAGAVETHSNNLYLQLAAETGILGLLAFLLVVVLAVAPLVRRLLQRPAAALSAPASTRTWIVGAALVAAVAAFLGHGTVDYFFSFNPTNGLWWATLGLVLAAPTE
jgi:O-antigen ligase